jgi:hypothetical protein
MPSLDEFAVGKERPKGRASFWSLLPAEVREEVVASDCSTAVAVEWLLELGFVGATFGNVDPQRRNERRKRERTSEP